MLAIHLHDSEDIENKNHATHLTYRDTTQTTPKTYSRNIEKIPKPTSSMQLYIW